MKIENYSEHRPQLRVRNNIEVISDGPSDRTLACVVGPCSAAFSVLNCSDSIAIDSQSPVKEYTLNEFFPNMSLALRAAIAIEISNSTESYFTWTDENGIVLSKDASPVVTFSVKNDQVYVNLSSEYSDGTAFLALGDNTTSAIAYETSIDTIKPIVIDYNNAKLNKTYKAAKYITGESDIESYFGPISKSNTLAFACRFMLEAGSGNALYADTVNVSSDAQSPQEVAAYRTSYKKLSNTDKFMHIVPLTTNVEVGILTKNHVNECSAETVMRWRGGFFAVESGDNLAESNNTAVDVAQRLSSSLMTLVYAPGGAYYATTDDAGNVVEDTLPAYFIAAGVAALTASVLPQQAISRMELPWISSVPASYTDLDATDLDGIAENGVMLIVQDDEDTVPYIRHQLTTDTSKGLMYYEQSIRVNTQSVNYMIKDLFKDYPGKKNLTENILIGMQIKAENALNNLTHIQDSVAEADCGPQLVSVNSVSVTRSPVYADRALVVANVSMALPMNVVDVTINTSVGY